MRNLAALGWLVVGLAVLSYPDPRPTQRRSTQRRSAQRGSAQRRLDLRGHRPMRLPPSLRRALVAGSGIGAVGVLTGSAWWLVLCGMVVVGGLVTRVPVRVTPAERMALRHQLAVHADLLAACLDAGMAVGPALTVIAAHFDPVGGVGDQTGPPVGRSLDQDTSKRQHARREGSRQILWPKATAPQEPLEALRSVAALLALGASAELSWQPTDEHRDLAGLAAAARRSAAGGVALADAVREHGLALRAANALENERLAGRAGVAMTGPLGLCFLPAFLCLGLAPVVVGLLGTIGIF